MVVVLVRILLVSISMWSMMVDNRCEAQKHTKQLFYLSFPGFLGVPRGQTTRNRKTT
jgi:hypothetical protein